MSIARCFCVSLCLLSACAAHARNGDDPVRTVKVGKLTRSYIVHLPPAYDGKKPLPVVLVFHGGAGEARSFLQWCGMNDKADQAGFIAVYPNGTGILKDRLLTFNAGICCGYAEKNNIDDVAFVRALLDDLGSQYKVDNRRVYATGMSNGGMISYRLALELSDRIAAIAPVGGTMGIKNPSRPERAVPVLHFHGTKDEHIAYNGGPGSKSITKDDFMSVSDSVGWWVKNNGCSPRPKVDQLPDRADDGMRSKREVWSGPAPVELITVEGGGHTWPGRAAVPDNATRFRKARMRRTLGESTKDISANDIMWSFFQKFALPALEEAKSE